MNLFLTPVMGMINVFSFGSVPQFKSFLVQLGQERLLSGSVLKQILVIHRVNYSLRLEVWKLNRESQRSAASGPIRGHGLSCGINHR